MTILADGGISTELMSKVVTEVWEDMIKKIA
jgi:hypothetical protein